MNCSRCMGITRPCEACIMAARPCPAWFDEQHCYIPVPEMTESGANVKTWVEKRCACGASVESSVANAGRLLAEAVRALPDPTEKT